MENIDLSQAVLRVPQLAACGPFVAREAPPCGTWKNNKKERKRNVFFPLVFSFFLGLIKVTCIVFVCDMKCEITVMTIIFNHIQGLLALRVCTNGTK